MIDRPYVIDRETLKTFLQISDTTYDTLIDLYLPIVSEDISEICHQDFVKEYEGTLTSSSLDITNIDIKKVAKGWLVSTKDYTNSKITDADIEYKSITVSDTATTTGDKETVYINEFPLAKRLVACQMVAYQLNKNNGVSKSTKGSLQSRSIPPLSETFNTNDIELDAGFGYPKFMISSLKQITKPRFY